MNDKMKRIDALESVLSDNESQSKAETLAELLSQGVDTDDFLSRVRQVVRKPIMTTIVSEIIREMTEFRDQSRQQSTGRSSKAQIPEAKLTEWINELNR